MSERRRLLAIGAHAGDMEFTAGAVIAKYTAAGHGAFLLHLTPGEKGHPLLGPADYARQKIEEAQRAAAVLGAEVRFLPYRDAELPLNEEVKLAICDVIREVKPDIVITHWGGSIHPDHERTYLNVRDALLYAALPGIPRPLPPHRVRGVYYAENWEDPYGFEPEVYVDTASSFDTWLKAAAQYELFRGGVSDFRYADYYQSLAVMRGCLSGFRYACAFMRPGEARRVKGDIL